MPVHFFPHVGYGEVAYYDISSAKSNWCWIGLFYVGLGMLINATKNRIISNVVLCIII